MHSKNFVRSFLFMTAAALIAIPTGVYAAGDPQFGEDPGENQVVNTDPPPTPSSAVPVAPLPRRKANEKRRVAMNEFLRAQRHAQEVEANPNSTEEQIQTAETAVDVARDAMNSAEGKITAAKRKERKVVRDEKTIAENEAEMTKINGTDTTGMSAEDVQALQERVKLLASDNERLRKRIERKKTAYKKKVDEDMWVHCTGNTERVVAKDGKDSCQAKCGAKEERNPDTLACRAICDPKTETRNSDDKCVAIEKKLDPSEQRKLAECYSPGGKLKKKVYAFFSMGSDKQVAVDDQGKKIVKTKEAIASEKKNNEAITDLFDKEIVAAQTEMKDSKLDKISLVEATSYGSHVSGKTVKAEDLSKRRSAYSQKRLFAFLLANGSPDIQTPDYPTGTDVGISVPPKVEGGPKYKKSDYAILANQKTTPAQLKAAILKAAKEILASEDPTPVRAPIDVRTPITGGYSSTPIPEEKRLEMTVKNLTDCCGANLATVKYQPFQFTEMTISASKFDPGTQACIDKSKKVANGTAPKPVELQKTGEKNDALKDFSGEDGIPEKKAFDGG